MDVEAREGVASEFGAFGGVGGVFGVEFLAGTEIRKGRGDFAGLGLATYQSVRGLPDGSPRQQEGARIRFVR